MNWARESEDSAKISMRRAKRVRRERERASDRRERGAAKRRGAMKSTTTALSPLSSDQTMGVAVL